MATTGEATQATPGAGPSQYDGFISYSHAADDLLAPRLQAGLQRFAKPWWRHRALRIFRDEASLSANPHLWSSITEALNGSEWFVLLLSEDAARSEWVNREVEYWVANKDASRILPVVTDGEFGWVDGDVSGSSVPPTLHGVFAEEPRWVDLRFAKSDESLDLKNPDFSAAIADVASAVRGIPKDELASEEVRQHRRTIRTAWAAGVALLALAFAAVGFGLQSANNARVADENAADATAQRNLAQENEASAVAQAERADREAANAIRASQLAESRELAAAAVANLERDPELATLLALSALDAAPPQDDPPVELVNAIWQASTSNRLIGVIETGHRGHIGLSPDGSRLAATVAPNVLRMYDGQTHEAVWDYSEETLDYFAYPTISVDGRVALAVFDSAAEYGDTPVTGSDELPNRVVVLTSEGEMEMTIEFPTDCLTSGIAEWSPDGRYLAVGGEGGCARNGSPQWLEVFDTTDWASVAFLPADGRGDLGILPRFDTAGNLFGLRAAEPALLYEAETFALLEESEATGIGDVSPDGERIFGFYALQSLTGVAGWPFSVLALDSATGAPTDVLYTGIRYPTYPLGVTATDDGKFVIVATDGTSTHVYDPITGVEELALPTGRVETTAYDAGAQLLYTSGGSEGIFIWRLGTAPADTTQTADLGRFSWVNGDGFLVGEDLGVMAAQGSGEWASVVFDPTEGNLQRIVPFAAPAALLSNGRVLAHFDDRTSASDVILDPATGDLQVIFDCQNYDPDEGCRDPGYHFATSLGGETLLAFPVTDDKKLAGELLTVDIDSGVVLSTEDIAEDHLWVEVLTDEWMIGSPTARRDLQVVDRMSGEILWADVHGHIRQTVAASGRWLVTRGSASIEIVDTATWTGVLVEGFDNIRGVSFNEEETLLAVGDARALRVIDVATGLVAQQIQIPGVSDVHWIDESTLLIGTNTGFVGKISISTDELIERTRSGLRRGFTTQECFSYRIDPCPTLDEMRSG